MNIEVFNRKTKIERSIETREKTESRYKVDLRPRTELENAIKTLYDTLRGKWRDRPIDEAVNIYINARSLRHDVWVEFFNNTNNHNLRAGDVRVNEFCRRMLNLKKIKIDVTHTEGNLSPDLLFYIPTMNCFLIGDIAVTTSERATNSRKYHKYMDVADKIRKAGERVKHTNLIIRDDLENIQNSLAPFFDMGILEANTEMTRRATEYCRIANKVMTEVSKTTDDSQEFFRRVEELDRLKPETDVSVEIPKLSNPPNVSPVKPIMSEYEIGTMIKDKTEKLMGENYFETDINKINNAFQDIYDKNRTEEHMEPKATLKFTDNSADIEEKANHDLVIDYLYDIQMFNKDDKLAEYFTDLLPSIKQCDIMKKIYVDKVPYKDAKRDYKKYGVHGSYQYNRTKNSNNILTSDLNEKLSFGKKKRNAKTTPKVINPDNYKDSMEKITDMIKCYGAKSKKASFLDDSWDAKTNFEMEATNDAKEIYDYVRKTNGAQLCHALSNLYQRITHLKVSQGDKDNIYIPPNGSFICVIPKDHAPISNKTCDLPFIFMTRFKKGKKTDKMLKGSEFEHKLETEEYIYISSKLFRLNIDKIAHWDQAGHKLVASCTYMLTHCKELLSFKKKCVGTMTILLLNSHQKTSEYLELLKYISYMPFSDVHRLHELVTDKMDLMIKTSLDVWILNKLQFFVQDLTDTTKLHAIKPKVQIFNANVVKESLGLSMSLPSFICRGVRHKSIAPFIEEVSILFTIRPKQLYGSQFLDKSIHATASWNEEYKDEIKEHGGWVVGGHDDNKEFPFDAKFAYSKDAIIHATDHYLKHIPVTKRMVDQKIVKTKYDKYMHYNCSLRGCVKGKSKRKNNNDYHTTSLEECLTEYHMAGYNAKKCTAVYMAYRFIDERMIPAFAQSEKEQRGPGRPISTPDLFAKAILMMIEKPEQAIGELVQNNIVVPGKNKLKVQSDTYKDLLAEGSINNKKCVFQCTEDQSKFSENDNIRKYEWYIRNNNLLNQDIREYQLAGLNSLNKREHLFHRTPKRLLEDPVLVQYLNDDRNGIKVNIGWPQGMLNFISTSIHSMADIWITHMFNRMYPDETVVVKGLVHSDDSWCAVACDSVDIFKKFCIFRMYAKRLFCLKMNVKKFWGSRYMGELVSNYNINGNVHLSVGKIVINCFSNLTYMNWITDVSSQISSIQQAYRSGADLSTLIILSTVLRQQIVNSYGVSGIQSDLLHCLPIELGGYPKSSVLELGVTGLNSHYNDLINMVRQNPNADFSLIMLRALRMSLSLNVDKEKTCDSITNMYKCKTDLLRKYYKNTENIEGSGINFNDIDYETINVPSRGEVFSCFKHIMPKSRKVSETIDRIKALPFEPTGVEMIVTHPKLISEALGNLKANTSSLMYKLAAEKYTSSSKRLAISQAIQASGKVVRIGNFDPMTMNEALNFVLQSDNVIMTSPDMLETAFIDDTNISAICHDIVYTSNYAPLNMDKRKIVNKQPGVEDKFTTVASLKNVLLYTIDKAEKTQLLNKYGYNIENLSILKSDSELIIKRFNPLFKFYTTRVACNLIMQQYMSATGSKLWMQPYLKTDSISNFFCDLYGKTISSSMNYQVTIDYGSCRHKFNNYETDIVHTLHTVTVMNSIYKGKFEPVKIMGKSIRSILRDLDYVKLSQDNYLKYAALCITYCNDDSHAKKFDSRNVYDQVFDIEQKYINGKYVGKFKATVRYGRTVIVISGEEKDVSLTCNTNNIDEILFAMMNFVNKNFSFYRYSHPSSWATCGFWENKMPISRLFLTSYSNNVTIITTSKTVYSIPICINTRLVMAETHNKKTADKYWVDEYSKTLYKTIHNDNIKVSHIKQTLLCPLVKNVELISDELEGLDNTDLLHTKLIINIATRKLFNCNISDVKKVMDNRITPFSGSHIREFWCGLLSCFINVPELMLRNKSANEPIMHDMDILDQHMFTLVEHGLTTSPEDLSTINVDFMMDDEDRVGAIYIDNSILETLSKVLSGHLTKDNMEDIIYLLIKDKDVVTLLKEDLEKSREELILKDREIASIVEYTEIPSALYALIESSRMNTCDFWLEIDMEDIMKRDTPPNLTSNVLNFKKELKKKILEIIYEVDYIEEEESELIAMAKHVKKMRKK